MSDNPILNILIIESDPQKASAIKDSLHELGIRFNLVKHLLKAKEAVKFLNELKHIRPDLVFSNYRMIDGLQSQVFDRLQETYPVIFITGTEEFPTEKKGSIVIDRVCIPVTTEKIKSALVYFHEMKKSLPVTDTEKKSPVSTASHQYNPQVKFLLLKKGTEYKNVSIEDIVYIYSENKLAFAVTKTGHKYIALTNLKGLEKDLRRADFFRANRNTVINKKYIDSFRTFEKVKIEVRFVNIANTNFIPVIVSQDSAMFFRQWIGLTSSVH